MRQLHRPAIQVRGMYCTCKLGSIVQVRWAYGPRGFTNKLAKLATSRPPVRYLTRWRRRYCRVSLTALRVVQLRLFPFLVLFSRLELWHVVSPCHLPVQSGYSCLRRAHCQKRSPYMPAFNREKCSCEHHPEGGGVPEPRCKGYAGYRPLCPAHGFGAAVRLCRWHPRPANVPRHT